MISRMFGFGKENIVRLINLAMMASVIRLPIDLKSLKQFKF